MCDQKYFGRKVQIAFFLGNMIGVLCLGSFSDWFGRKRAYMTSLTLWIIFGISGYFATNKYVWLVIRLFCGASSLSFNTAQSVYLLELTSGKWKAVTGSWFRELPWLIGHLSLGLLVYLIPNMHHLELFIGVSGILFLPLWYFLPESPRWLVSKGKLTEAQKVLVSACSYNKKPTEPVEQAMEKLALSQNNKNMEKSGLLHEFFKTPAIRRNSIVMCFCWLSFSMGFFGLVYNTPPFDENIYLVFVVPAIMAIPLSILEPYLNNTLGRKKMLTTPLITAGIMLLIATIIRMGNGASNWPVIILAWIGTCCCQVAFGLGYLFTEELYPTLYRTTALGMTSAAARVGSLLSPIIAMLDFVHPVLPIGIYGAIVLSAGMSSILLWPETLDLHFTTTLEECEALASTPNKWLSCCKASSISKKNNVEYPQVDDDQNEQANETQMDNSSS